MPGEAAVATVAFAVVTASLPFYLYGAWYVVDADPVTWRVLRRHLAVVGVGLVLTTLPVLAWMAPRLPGQFGGFSALHAFFGLQAYALLTFALTGIVPLFRAKRARDLYDTPDRDLELDAIHENAPQWRRRLRVGVLGFVALWCVAWLLGVVRYVLRYVL